MIGETVTQLVGFSTRLSPDDFVERWQPVASGFLRSGLHTITLAVFDGDGSDDLRYLSRNTWPAEAYRRAFPAGLAADGGGGPVTVMQAGVYTADPATAAPVITARPAFDLSVALLRLAGADEARDVAGATRELLAVLRDARAGDLVAYHGAHRPQRFDVALTVHASAGAGPATTEALRAAAAPMIDARSSKFLTGRELLSLTS